MASIADKGCANLIVSSMGSYMGVPTGRASGIRGYSAQNDLLLSRTSTPSVSNEAP